MAARKGWAVSYFFISFLRLHVSKFVYLAAPYIIRADTKIGTMRMAFDIETDGLLDQATKIHCIVIAALDSDQIDTYGPDQIHAALEHLARADYLVGHNICGYDLPLLHRLHGWAPSSGCAITDTLVASRLILPNLDDLDDQAAAIGDRSLGKLRGRYSIEAWGARLGMPKIGADIEDWSKWTPEMQERCAGDVAICKALWRFMAPDGYSKQALDLEHRTAAICNRITADGVPFDVEAAERLHQQWITRRAELEAQLQQQFPGTNLNSRAQIGALLESRGWIPEKRTEKTKQPKIDDELLEFIPTIYPEFAGLSEYMLLGRRIASLADGNKAWMQHVGEDGRIHGAIVHIGTPHSRAAHFNPNLAQVPNPKKGKPLAAECRALFHHDGDWVFANCDQAGLQDRCFSHYLAAFDGGDYGRSFIAGVDTHWKSATALGLVTGERDKASKLHAALREGAKAFRYGFLFGMGSKRAGEMIAAIVRAARQINPSYQGPSTNGGQALRRFEAATPGLRQLRESLEARAARNAWVSGLDERRVPTGAQYKALNRIVTCAEAIVCKRWLINVHDELCARFCYGWDGDVVITAWVHDELVICCRPEIAKEIGEIMVRHARKAGEFYNLKVPLDAEYNIGRSWAGDAATENIEESRGPTSSSQPDHNDEKANFADGPAVKKRANGAINKIRCPFHDDHSPSLELYADGHYHCYVCHAHGDIEDLPEAPPLAPKAPENKTDTLQRAARIWHATIPIHGTLAERYLIEIRKLDLAVVSDIDEVLRFHAKCPFNGSVHPCLVALFRDVETNEVAGIHRIALTANAEKIDRMMLGSWPTPRAIKLRPTGEELLIGEGIETSVAGEMKICWRSGLWALGSAGSIGQLPVINGVKKLGVLVDRDRNGVGEEASRRCATRWKSADRRVLLLIPQRTDTDFNDIVKEKGA
jgi:DNA polymerase-1